MSEMVEVFGAIKDHKKRLRAKYGAPCPECKRLLERLSEQWMKIKTAPKDKEILLFYPGTGAVRGHWFDDILSANPRQYWRSDRLFLWGMRRSRQEQPTHWMHLPQPLGVGIDSTPPTKPTGAV